MALGQALWNSKISACSDFCPTNKSSYTTFLRLLCDFHSHFMSTVPPIPGIDRVWTSVLTLFVAKCVFLPGWDQRKEKNIFFTISLISCEKNIMIVTGPVCQHLYCTTLWTVVLFSQQLMLIIHCCTLLFALSPPNLIFLSS